MNNAELKAKKTIKYIILPIRILYFLLPKILRDQYHDSIIFYKMLALRFLDKLSNALTNSAYSTTKLFALVKDINMLDCDFKLIFQETGRVGEISGPKLILDGNTYVKGKLKNKLPDIEIYILNNISVVGNTDAVIASDKFTHSELSLMRDYHDLKRPEIFSKSNVKKPHNRFCNTTSEIAYYKITTTNLREDNENKTKTYISLIKEHSQNYFHWTTEILPRLVLIIQALRKNVKDFNWNDYVILLDDGLSHQCIESLRLVAGANTLFRFIGKGEILFCDKVVYCKPLWNSLDNTTGMANPKLDFYVDKQSISMVRDALLSSYDKTVELHTRKKKIYLQRPNNRLRRITNLHDLEMVLIKHNFEFVNLESLDLSEQIKLFQNIDVAIGVSGAAFTNLLYMKGGAKCIIFYPSSPSTNYYVFQPLADISGVDLLHYLTIPNDKELSLHAEASINVKFLEAILKNVENNCELSTD